MAKQRKTAVNDKANRKADNQKALTEEAKVAHYPGLGFVHEPSLRKRWDARDSAEAQRAKATTISSARGAKIAAAKAKSSGGTVTVNMSNGTTYTRRKPKK